MDSDVLWICADTQKKLFKGQSVLFKSSERWIVCMCYILWPPHVSFIISHFPKVIPGFFFTFVHPFLGVARWHPSQPDRGASAAPSDPQEAERVHPGGGGGVSQAVDAVCRRSQTPAICRPLRTFRPLMDYICNILCLALMMMSQKREMLRRLGPHSWCVCVWLPSRSVISCQELFGSRLFQQKTWVTVWFCCVSLSNRRLKESASKIQAVCSGSVGFGLLSCIENEIPFVAPTAQTLAHSCAVGVCWRFTTSWAERQLQRDPRFLHGNDSTVDWSSDMSILPNGSWFFVPCELSWAAIKQMQASVQTLFSLRRGSKHQKCHKPTRKLGSFHPFQLRVQCFPAKEWQRAHLFLSIIIFMAFLTQAFSGWD